MLAAAKLPLRWDKLDPAQQMLLLAYEECRDHDDFVSAGGMEEAPSP